MASISRKFPVWLRYFGTSLKSSWISLLICLLVFLLTSLEQSDTIVVNLLDDNLGNFLLFVLLLLFLTQIVSHYPIYLEIKQNRTRSKPVRWNIEPVFLGLGFITFDGDVPRKSKIVGHLRNLWGLLLLWAVFYLLLVVHSRNIEVFGYEGHAEKAVLRWRWIQVVLYVLFCLVSYGLISHYFTRKYRAYRKVLINATLALFLIVFSVALIFSATRGWSQTTYRWVYALLYAAAPCYSAIRLFRKNTLLRKDLTLLIFIAVGGFGSLLMLVLAHYYVFAFNPLVILLAQFIVLYGIVIIPLKHFFYYRQKEIAPKLGFWKRAVFLGLFRRHIPILIIVSIVAGFIGNDLHLLPTVEEQKEVVSFDDFVDDFDDRFTPDDTVYFVASFGGGLKANIWNQLILDTLANFNGHPILSHTVAISGVSGGAIGHAVFSGLYNKHPGTDSTALKIRKSEIEKLGSKNFVSLDLAYLLGKDLLYELIPDFLYRSMGQTNDRAKRAMEEYSHFVNGDSTMLSGTFRSFWATLYRKEKAVGRFFPAIIANAAGTHIQRGIACSVKMTGEQFDSTFFDSTDLLTFAGDTTSLPFLYAASCTNRFPIFSPAAKVNEKGHFIDGGYFENSGMLSLLDFSEALKSRSECFRRGAKDSTRKEPTVIFIQIINGKDEYLKSLLKGQQGKKSVKEAPEVSSILGTVTSISFVPSYLMKRSALDSHYVQIHLPYYITEKDINALFKAENFILNDSSQHNKDQSNSRLIAMQDSNPYQFVQPPLARLLGKQAVNYMEATLRQEATWADLNRLFTDAKKTQPANLKGNLLVKSTQQD